MICVDLKKMEPYNIDYVDKKRFTYLTCSLCEDHGACIQCQRARCMTAVHPQCALEKDSKFTNRVVKNPEGSGGLWQIFCSVHANDVVGPVEIGKKRYVAEVLSEISYTGPRKDNEKKSSDDFKPSSDPSSTQQSSSPSTSSTLAKKGTSTKDSLVHQFSSEVQFEVEFHRICFEAFRFDFSALKLSMPHVTDLRLKEFKRFLVLKALYQDISSQMFEPSESIEEVWCGMILCTVEYRSLCQLLLPDKCTIRFMDHDPRSSIRTHVERYCSLLQAYRKYFEREPPEEFWPPKESWLRMLNAETETPECKKSRVESVDSGTVPSVESKKVVLTSQAIIESSTKIASAEDVDLYVTLCLKDLANLEDVNTFLKVRVKTRMGKVLNVYAKRNNKDVGSLCLKSLNGKIISNESTPKDLNLKDDDVILVDIVN